MERIGKDEICEQIAELESCDEAIVKLFVQNLLSQVKKELEEGNEVRLDGLGILSIIEKSGDKFSNLQFEEEFKEDVNAPFSLFEPIELTAATIKESAQDIEHKTIEQINKESDEEAKPLEADAAKESTLQISEEAPLSEDAPAAINGDEVAKEESSLSEKNTSSEDSPAIIEAKEVATEESPLSEETPLSEDTPTTIEEEKVAVEKVSLSKENTSEQGSLALEEETTQEEIQEETPVVPIGTYQRPPAHDEEAKLHLRRRKKRVRMNWVSVVVFIFIISVLVYFAPKYMSGFSNSDEAKTPMLVEQVQTSVVTSTEVISDTVEVEIEAEAVEETLEDTAIPEVNNTEVEKEEKPAVVPVLGVNTQPLPESVVLENGERLALLARRYYGSMYFWVYIYDYNKAVYPNPDMIPVGAKLLLPPPSEYAMDKDDPESIERAKAMIDDLKK